MLLRLFTSIESIGCEYYVTVCPLSSSAYSDVTLTAWNVRRWEYLHHVAIAVHSLSRVRLCDAMDCSRPGFPVHHQLLELAHTHSHWVNDVIQPSHPLSSVFPSIRIFSSESVLCIRWPKYWSFSFSINPSNEYSGLISFRIDWLDLLVIQGTLKSLLQHHSSKASVFWCSAFLMVHLSHP